MNTLPTNNVGPVTKFRKVTTGLQEKVSSITDGWFFDFKQLGVALLILTVMAGVVHAWNPDLMRRSAALYGPTATRVTVDIQTLLASNAGLSEADQVGNTNIFINARLTQDLDRNVWGIEDYWASPMEFFSKERGDCEDFAIAKYYTLLALGVPQERLRLIYVMFSAAPNELQQAHMVLAYYQFPDVEPYILDNLIDDVRLASYRPDLEPIFSFNGDGLWWGTLGNEAGNPLASLSPWRRVVSKAKNQGFMN
ncbi:transglutaminase-like cysteine peptidase [Leptothrix ochracea]|uniref:transglutaminase-like cysteine peptidase n=1 Tax=Leptothrix ochracea TaxID=735331 RepID=UPI0034E2CCB3